MNVPDAVLVDRLKEAFTGRSCVSAWLGHGDVLFLGLGEDVLPERNQEGGRPRPPFELETNFADWFVARPTMAPTELTRSDSRAAESLVGKRISNWQMLDGFGLRLTFMDGDKLTVAPWPIDDGVSDAWSVRAPDGQILAASNDGKVVVVDERTPVRDWFGPST